ncbi:hypothetical protein [Nannocystis pusilla]|uniref:hypothetical protein n=1 Tax=Nannocystis pusilla TaxID=889268 RepID=UPI003B80F966
MGAGGPRLEVGHLHPGGRVDAVGGLDEGDEEHGLELGGRLFAAIARRMASMRAPFFGWKKRASSQNVRVT